MGFTHKFFDIESCDPMQHLMRKPNMRVLDKWRDGEQYTKMWEWWQNGEIPSPSDTELQELREKMEKVHGEEKTQEYFEKFAKKGVLKNPAWVQFMMDTAWESKSYPDWQLMLPHAFNLQAAWSHDVHGNLIDKDDPFFWYTVFYPIFVTIRFRTEVAAEYMKAKSNVTILGCGKLPELKQVLSKFPDLLPNKIVACDKDAQVAQWAKTYARTPLMVGRLDFRHQDMVEVLKSLPNGSQDVIRLGGILSYATHAIEKLMLLAWMKLKPGGVIVTDLQVLEWSLDCCIKMHGWQMPEPLQFLPSQTLEHAVAMMNEGVKHLPYSGLDYYVDPRLKDPIEATFVATKGRFRIKMLIPLFKMLSSQLFKKR